MTSSKRNGIVSDFSKAEYKPHDPMCEPGLVSILFLSCNKHKLADISLASTHAATRAHAGEIEWCLLEQGTGEDADDNIRLFRDLKVERKAIILPDTNYGINSGFNSLWAISRGEFCMHHESDWLNRHTFFDFLQLAKEIMAEKSEVGIVQLRAPSDPNENWGRGKPQYNPWSCSTKELEDAKVKVWLEKTKSGHEYGISEFANGWNHNPQLVRKSLFRECGPLPEPPLNCDLRHGETEMAERVANTGCAIAHIGIELYYHIGGAVRSLYERS